MKYQYLDNEKQHLHLLDDRPLTGTSTVIEVLAKPLTWWASGLAVSELGWTKMKEGNKFLPFESRLPVASKRFTEIKQLSDEDYLKLLDKAYYAHFDSMKKSATKGTDRHKMVEDWVKSVIAGNEIPPHEDIASFVTWASQNIKRYIGSEVHCYSEKNWLGGISDLVAELNDGKLVVIDIKSSKEAYINQYFQIAGYDIELSENGGFTADGELLFKLDRPIDGYIVFPFGMKEPEPQFYWDVEGAKRGFLACLTLYRLLPSNN